VLVDPQPHAVAAVHADRDVLDLGLIDRDRAQHPEEGHRTRDIGEQVEIETRTTDGAHDPPHDPIVVTLGRELRGQSASGGLGFGKLWFVSEMVDPRLLDEAFAPNDPNYNPDDSVMREIYCRV
jgi:hypothetical protein